MAIPSICILAGGRGTRLGSLTDETPKPLLPVGGRPFIEHILSDLSTSGAQRVVLSIGYLAEQFRQILGDGDRFELELLYVEDGDEPAGTAGGVRNCLPLLDDPFIVMYGDSLLRVNPNDLVAAHVHGKRAATMAVMRSSLGHETPNCTVDDNGITAYSRHPAPSNAQFVDYGMLVFSKAAFSDFTGPDLSTLQSKLAAEGSLTAFQVDVPYMEIGTPESLEAAAANLRAKL